MPPLPPEPIKNDDAAPGSFEARLAERRKMHVSQRPSTRLVDMKVLVLGLCRTGTASIREALFQLGYNDVYHTLTIIKESNGEADMWAKAFERKARGQWALTREESDILLGYSEATTDTPAAYFVDELIALYPDAKVILTVRDTPEAWHKSMLDTVYYQRNRIPWMQPTWFAEALINLPGITMPTHARMINRLCRALFPPGRAFDDAAVGAAVYNAHNDSVLRAKGRDNVLVYNVKEGWDPLCAFLGKEVPDTEFPRLNDTVTFRARIDAVLKKLQEERGGGPKLLALAVAGAGAVAGVAFLLRRYYPSR